MREKALVKNTISALLLQITAVFCGFIIPRLIMGTYGSEVNGLVNSINQFLHIISFMELGVGAVVQSALYRPLAMKDIVLVSGIMVSAKRYFKFVGKILLIYVVILIIIYPYIANSNFDCIYSGTLIASMAISYFAQYYWGLSNQLLLSADQRAYIHNYAQIFSLLLNAFACILLINNGASIQFVKFITSVIFLLRPIVLMIYVRNNYGIRNERLDKDPIKQKWNGIAQHLASAAVDVTDNVVLTLFSSLSLVSVYSVYHLVVYGIRTFFFAVTNGGLQSVLGELYAKNNINKLHMLFSYTEWVIHTSACWLFSCTGILIVPFVRVYTYGISDVNYNQPIFAMLIVIAELIYCLRLPYNIMVKAAGRYKETQYSYLVSLLLNIIFSVVLVKKIGIVGVAVGTIIAMLYQLIWMAVYSSRYILMCPSTRFFKQIIVDIISVVICLYFASFLQSDSVDYTSWTMMSLKCSIVCGVIVFIVNVVFYNKMIKNIIRRYT